MTHRYEKSEKLLKRALKTIPLGSQTFSKSLTQYPLGVSPYFIQRGYGAYVWDVDGNKYVDFVSALASITLGYNDPDVNSAVRSQLEEGTIFSLSHPIELSVAEKICEIVPCAELVRFGKNGSDATAAAVRLARAFTQKDHIVVCGYHGWQDWYIGSTMRDLGVPTATKNLTHVFKYNDLQSLVDIFKKLPNQVAAVIMEPMNTDEPNDGFLNCVKDIAHKNGALLVFDETITGFRYSIGGAQEYFGVIPDLATFGKGLANGFPLSVITGRADVMKLMEEIFFSFTFGGETLSLAAALATMNKYESHPVIENINQNGKKIKERLLSLVKNNNVSHMLNIVGHPSWSFILFKDTDSYTQWELKSLYMQEMLKHGVITFGSHNLNYSHGETELNLLFNAYERVISLLSEVDKMKTLHKVLCCKPIEPLFRVR